MEQVPKYRIGELSYRVGIRPELLRAWERRYGLLRPERSDKGFRLYSDADEWRVRLMQQKIQAGMSAAEAAREVEGAEGERDAGQQLETPLELTAALSSALEQFDEDGAHAVVDRLLGIHGLDLAIRQALMPYLKDVGERWARGELSVAQEHFASRLLEGRLLALARGWNKGPGRRAVLACASGEAHTLPLICFGLVLRNHGWRNVYLGADSPVSTVHMAADTVDADVVVMSAVSPDRFEPISMELSALARRRSLVLGGAGATLELESTLGIECLKGDPATAAEDLSRRFVLQGA